MGISLDQVAHELGRSKQDIADYVLVHRGQKLAVIEAKPAGQQFGLEMTQKLLKNVEEEISTLEAQYASSST